MKKRTLTLLLALAMSVSSFGFVGCGGEPDLRVYNCFDYIDETLLTEFENYMFEKTGDRIRVEYSTFDTPEDCYNQLKIYPDHYDLVCPSDYMIEKMAKEDMLEEITMPADGWYKQNLSPFIKEKFEEISWGDKNLSNYAAGYMWGTLGLVYNSATVTDDEMKSWSSLWNRTGDFTIKDSVRDTYFIGLAKHYNTELLARKAEYLEGGSLAEYQAALKEMLNDTKASTVDAVKNSLIELKNKSFGLEVDSGKDDIISGNTDVYFAWSGDAVYALDEGDSLASPVTLKYSVPEEGSNIWFDGWCVPKNAKNKELAIEFIDFMSKPENVIQNMEYIGYVSCIAGEEIFDWVTDTYGANDGEGVNLNYFFKTSGSSENYSVVTDVVGRQFSAQYPSEEVINRCVVMNYFPSEANDRITSMWIAITG